MSNELLTHKQMYEKYKELKSKGFVYPYTYKLIKNNKSLYFLGAKHSNDPNDSQFEIIKNLWLEFTEATGSENRIVLIEGGVTPVAENEKEAIQKYAEPGCMTYLAHTQQVQILSPEPTEDFETSVLVEKYGKEVVAVYQFANIVSQWQRFEIKEDLDAYISKYLGRFFHKPIWQSFDFSPTNLKVLYKKVTDRVFDSSDKEFIFDFITPTDSNISGFSDDIRDNFILKKIRELWSSNNLFIVYGSGHALRLEDALRQIN